MSCDKHIVHVTDALAGGVLIWLREVTEELDRRGWRITLVYDPDRCKHTDPKTLGLPSCVSLYPMNLGRSLSPFKVTATILKLSSLFKDISPSVIHLHSSIAGAVGRVAALLAGVSNKTIYSPHGLAFLRQDVPWIIRKVFFLGEWAGSRLGGGGVACSVGERDQMSLYYSSKRLYLIENSVDCSKVIPKKEGNNSKPLIGTIGRISAQKAPDNYASMVKAIGEDIADFLWIGDGDTESASNLFKAGVNVLGWLPRDVAMDTLSGLDIYVSTALWEGMPLALIEAQIAGIPAVVSDVVGNRDIVVDGETGFVASNQEQLENYVRQLINDKGLRIRLGKQARETSIKRFNLEHMVDSLETLYNNFACGH